MYEEMHKTSVRLLHLIEQCAPKTHLSIPIPPIQFDSAVYSSLTLHYSKKSLLPVATSLTDNL